MFIYSQHFFSDGINVVEYNKEEIDRLLTSSTCEITVSHKISPMRRQWDYANCFQHCGCLFLISEGAQARKKLCCKQGALLSEESFPGLQLLPLLDELRFLTQNKLEHMGCRSSYYNRILALGATGWKLGNYSWRSCSKTEW